ncbi:MAG TPA: alpha/beta hydrolase-fold protein [Opitutus sp.]|nr:alpha/beta hydrolase-fold protein [Opitutus sp.]
MIRRRLRPTPFLLLLAVLLPAPPAARATPFTLANTEVVALPRSTNGRDYTLLIGLPASYASSPTRRYPVLYACDGYWDFHLLMAETGNLEYDGLIPDCIVVGFSYTGASPDYGTLRTWDLTPGYDPYGGANSGHAADFLGVIAGQFIPYVDSHYRTDTGFRVLSGSSYGGLFTVFALFERPGLFQAYIAPSPSLWWRSRFLLDTERTFATTHSSLSARLYLTFAGDESSAIRDSTRIFANQIRATGYSGFALAVREIEGERHSGTKGEAYNRGLRFAFAPLAPSPSATLNPGWNSRSPLVNVSTRGRVGAGGNVMIAGFVIDGPAPKRVLVRAVGPGLQTLGVTDPVADPQLRVVDVAHQTVATNDNWGDAPAIATAGAQVGAYPLAAGSRDAAVLLTLAPGLYTVVVSGVNGAEGVALAEVYEVLP